ncbi:MAG: VWA domain-containing protein [Gammaproteobacteria bacterium]
MSHLNTFISDFHFLRPIWLSAAIPLMIMVWFVINRCYKTSNWQSVIDKQLIPYVLTGKTARRQVWPIALFSLAGILAVIALAGPAWKQLEQPVFRDQSALVIALDLSRSMDSNDISPSRLIRARLKVIDILKRRKEGQTALIVYAADAFVVSPLTQDADTIIAQISSLKTGLMPGKGSRSSLALRRAEKLLQQAGVRQGDILLVSDGIDESESSRIIEIANNISESGHHLSVLGVGTADGAPIPLRGGGFLSDRSGAIVIPKLNEAALRNLASQGNGQYQRISADDSDLDHLLQVSINDKLEMETADSEMKTDLWREEGPWLLLLILPITAIAFRRGYLSIAVVLLLPVPEQSYALDWQSLWSTPDQQANTAFRQGEPEIAAQLFEDKQWQAASYYRAGQFDKSIAALDGIDTAEALYNKGNALAQTGRYAEAIASYSRALELNPDHADAKYNLDLVKQQLPDQDTQSGENQAGDQNSKDKDHQGNDSEDDNGHDPTQNSQQNQQEQNSSNNQNNSQQENTGQQNEQGDLQSAPQPAQDNTVKNNSTSDKENVPARYAQPEKGSEEKEGGESEAEQQALNQEAISESNQLDETQQANELWLRRIPDDPGGLLRRKFQYQAQQQRNKSSGDIQPW